MTSSDWLNMAAFKTQKRMNKELDFTNSKTPKKTQQQLNPWLMGENCKHPVLTTPAKCNNFLKLLNLLSQMVHK